MPRNAPPELDSEIAAQNGPVARDAETRSSLDARRDTSERPLSAEQLQRGPVQAGHQRFVLTDSVAFRYLEEDPSTVVLDRRRVLEGYECYIVEQWACARSHPTFVITTYTGDPSHKVVAGVLSVPTDEKAWSLRLRIYFKALSQYHARSRDTPLGTLMITNLSAFPSSLTVITVPDGDVRKHRESFFVNENLKRLGCSGRVGITLAPPSGATEYKFHQLYRTSEKIPLAGAVIELVKMCQVALILFGKLEPEYADGLLCDITEKAVNDWWIDIGNEYYSIEPHDGILGPTTVSALLGTLTGARNRLNAYGAPVGKDVFDIENTKRGIAYFQKSQRVPKTRRLDRKTLGLLHRATAKTASGEGWTVPKAVKSTVAELSGKGGEMVMDMVGGRDKAGIAEVETVDIERFVQLVHGERSKWLWYGKPRKHGNMFSRLPDEDLKASRKESKGEEDLEPPMNRYKDTTTEGLGLRKRDTGISIDKYSPEDKESRIKRATGKLGDARSGIGGRIKDAVGLRNLQHKHSRAENDTVPYAGNDRSENFLRRPSTIENRPQYPLDPSPRESMDISSAAEDTANDKSTKPQPRFANLLSETPHDSQAAVLSSQDSLPAGDEQPELGAILTDEGTAMSRTDTAGESIAGSVYRGIDLDELFEDNAQFEPGALLRRTNSFSNLITRRSYENGSGERWPRRLSLSIAEESLFRWQAVTYDSDDDAAANTTDPTKQLACEQLAAEESRLNGERLARLGNVVNAWVEGTITHVHDLNVMAERDQQELEEIYYPRLDEYNSLQEESKEIILQERAALQDAIKDIETLGAKLEYEVNVLQGKVEDVEGGVTEFERQVLVVEDMVQMLEDECQPKEGWLGWIYKGVAGRGKNTTTVET